MRFACWITKDRDTHSEYVILIAFEQQQWLHERVSVLRLYVHCLLLGVLNNTSVSLSRFDHDTCHETRYKIKNVE
jgi:hypothetical protein